MIVLELLQEIAVTDRDADVLERLVDASPDLSPAIGPPSAEREDRTSVRAKYPVP